MNIMTERPTVNIITRTASRPRFFEMNYQSVQEQKEHYSPIKHLVSCDDESSKDYLENYEDITVIEVERGEFRSDRFPPNLYCNTLTEAVENGWIIYLDDDDLFVQPDAVKTIMSYATDEDQILLWKVRFPNGRVIPKKFGRKPILG